MLLLIGWGGVLTEALNCGWNRGANAVVVFVCGSEITLSILSLLTHTLPHLPPDTSLVLAEPILS